MSTPKTDLVPAPTQGVPDSLTREQAILVLKKINSLGFLFITSEDTERGLPPVIQYIHGAPSMPPPELVDKAIAALMERNISSSDGFLVIDGDEVNRVVWPAHTYNRALRDRSDGHDEQNARDAQLVKEFKLRAQSVGIDMNQMLFLTPVEKNPRTGQMWCEANAYLTTHRLGIKARQETQTTMKPWVVEIKDPALRGDTKESHAAFRKAVGMLSHYLHSIAGQEGIVPTLALTEGFPALSGLSCMPVTFAHDKENGRLVVGSTAGVLTPLLLRADKHADTSGLAGSAYLQDDPGYLLAATMAQNGINFPGSEQFLPRGKNGLH